MCPDALQVDAAITRDVGKAVLVLLLVEPDLHDDRLDRLLQAIAAYLGDEFGAALGDMFHHAIGSTFLFKELAQPAVDIGVRLHAHGIALWMTFEAAARFAGDPGGL